MDNDCGVGHGDGGVLQEGGRGSLRLQKGSLKGTEFLRISICACLRSGCLLGSSMLSFSLCDRGAGLLDETSSLDGGGGSGRDRGGSRRERGWTERAWVTPPDEFPRDESCKSCPGRAHAGGRSHAWSWGGGHERRTYDEHGRACDVQNSRQHDAARGTRADGHGGRGCDRGFDRSRCVGREGRVRDVLNEAGRAGAGCSSV